MSTTSIIGVNNQIIKEYGNWSYYIDEDDEDKLSRYLEHMAWENVPYQEIKEKMIQEFGQPITDYSTLDYDALTYRKIDEFFLDNFHDFKSK